MLEFIKKIFAKQEEPEETIDLNNLSDWLDEKVKPINEGLNSNINQIIVKINDEKQKVTENIKKLETAKLQNPKIPDRAKTIMEGNRQAFIQKTSFFFNSIDLKYNNSEEILEKCNKIKNEIDSLGIATARSYQVLNEFFAREAEIVALNIKNLENYTKQIINLINESKIMNISKIKNEIISAQNKIKSREFSQNELNNENNNLKDYNNKKTESERKINQIKSENDFKNYENLLTKKEKIGSKLNEIESHLFHDFSALDKALKKYAKIAIENEKLILEYLNNPMITLIKDNEFKILKIIDNLKNAIETDLLGIDGKKKSKALEKLHELDGVYFNKIKDDFKNTKQKLNDLNYEIDNNSSKKELDSNNNELNNLNLNIESLNNKMLTLNNELEKINIKKLKENLQNEVNDIIKIKVVIH